MGKTQKAIKKSQRKLKHKTVADHQESVSSGNEVKTTADLIDDANDALTRSDYELAKTILMEAFKVAKNAQEQIHVLTQLGSIYLDVGMVTEAREAFLSAEEKARTDSSVQEIPYELYANLGQTSENPQEAWSWLNKVVETVEQDIMSNGNVDKEEDAHRRVVAATALLGMTEIYMTDLCMEPEAESQCVNQLEKAIQINPENPEVYQMMASVRMSQQREEEAKGLALEGWNLWRGDISKGPESLDSQVTLAKIFVEVGLFEYAIEILLNVLRQNDEFAEAYYVMGWTWLMLADRLQKEPKLLEDAKAGHADANLCRAEALCYLSSLCEAENDGVDGELVEHAKQLASQIDMNVEQAQQLVFEVNNPDLGEWVNEE